MSTIIILSLRWRLSTQGFHFKGVLPGFNIFMIMAGNYIQDIQSPVFRIKKTFLKKSVAVQLKPHLNFLSFWTLTEGIKYYFLPLSKIRVKDAFKKFNKKFLSAEKLNWFLVEYNPMASTDYNIIVLQS